MPGRGQITARSCTSWRRCRASTASSDDDDLSEAHGGAASRRSTATGRARPRPACGCCRASCPPTQLPKGVEYPQRGVPIGIDENNLEPVFVDFDTDPLFLVFGESESGKTNLLRLLAKQITERYDAGRRRKLFVGRLPPRACWARSPTSHLLEYAPMSNAMEHAHGRAGTT